MLLLLLLPQAVREMNHNRCTPMHVTAVSGRVDMLRRFDEVWPDGKRDRGLQNTTPWQMFDKRGSRPWDAGTEEEIRALLQIGDRV
jgi:hypothetical protein